MVVGIITKHLPNLEKKNYQAIAKDLRQPVEEIYEAAKVLKSSIPSPGAQYTAEEPTYITPDVYVHKVGDKYFVVANDDGLPKLKIPDFYRGAGRRLPRPASTSGKSCAARSGSSGRFSSASGRSSGSPSGS